MEISKSLLLLLLLLLLILFVRSSEDSSYLAISCVAHVCLSVCRIFAV